MIDSIVIPSPSDEKIADTKTTAEDRITAARLLLLKLSTDTNDPRWSSALLDGLVNTVTTTPGGAISDVLFAMSRIFMEYRPEMSSTLANFIKELVVKCFTVRRDCYGSVDWKTFILGIGPDAPRPLLYLALHGVPDQYMTEALTRRIVQGLAETSFGAEAKSLLAA